MRKEFSMSNDKIIINFTTKYCKTFEDLLDSEGFRRVLEDYLKKSKKKKTPNYRFLSETLGTDDNFSIRRSLTKIFKYLIVMNSKEIIENNPEFESVLSDKDSFVRVIENIYLFWRKLERYTVIHGGTVEQGLAAMSFTQANQAFSDLILKFYRKLEKNVIGVAPKVFRQIPAGGNASIMINNIEWPVPKEYKSLGSIPFIDSIMLQTPFITYPKMSTRDGVFSEVTTNPLKFSTINKDHFFCYPAKVGTLLAYIYFHRDYMEHGITHCNLFEMARKEWKR